MSRKNFQIKKSVPFKLRGASRNPFGNNVIIDKETHYGKKERQNLRDIAEETERERSSNRQNSHQKVSLLARAQSNEESTATNGYDELGEKMPQSAPNHLNKRLVKDSRGPLGAARSQIATSKGKKTAVAKSRTPIEQHDFDGSFLDEAKQVDLRSIDEAQANEVHREFSPEDKQRNLLQSQLSSRNGDIPEGIKDNITEQFSEFQHEQIKTEEADTGGAPVYDDLKRSQEFRNGNDPSRDVQNKFESTGMVFGSGSNVAHRTTVRGMFMNEHIPQSELQKKEEQKRKMKEDLEYLQKRKKDEEKQRERELQKMEEERIRKENEQLKKQMDMEKEAIARKTQANFFESSQTNPLKNSEYAHKQSPPRRLHNTNESTPDNNRSNNKFEEPTHPEGISQSRSEAVEKWNYSRSEHANETVVVAQKSDKLEEENSKLKQENTKQSEIIELLLGAIKSRDREGQSATKLLEELNELRAEKQSTYSQKKPPIYKQQPSPVQDHVPEEFRMNLSRQEQSYPHRYNQEDRSSQHPHQRVSSFHSQSQTRQSIPTEDEGSIGYQGYSNSNKIQSEPPRYSDLLPHRVYSSPNHGSALRLNIPNPFQANSALNQLEQKQRHVFNKSGQTNFTSHGERTITGGGGAAYYRSPQQAFTKNKDEEYYQDLHSAPLRASHSEIKLANNSSIGAQSQQQKFRHPQEAMHSHLDYRIRTATDFASNMGRSSIAEKPGFANVQRPDNVYNYRSESLRQSQNYMSSEAHQPSSMIGQIPNFQVNSKSTGLQNKIYFSDNKNGNDKMPGGSNGSMVSSKYDQERNANRIQNGYPELQSATSFMQQPSDNIVYQDRSKFPKDVFSLGVKKKFIA